MFQYVRLWSIKIIPIRRVFLILFLFSQITINKSFANQESLKEVMASFVNELLPQGNIENGEPARLYSCADYCFYRSHAGSRIFDQANGWETVGHIVFQTNGEHITVPGIEGNIAWENHMSPLMARRDINGDIVDIRVAETFQFNFDNDLPTMEEWVENLVSWGDFIDSDEHYSVGFVEATLNPRLNQQWWPQHRDFDFLRAKASSSMNITWAEAATTKKLAAFNSANKLAASKLELEWWASEQGDELPDPSDIQIIYRDFMQSYESLSFPEMVSNLVRIARRVGSNIFETLNSWFRMCNN